jgi:cystathionine beta-lyase/cystathionine gamma-synthase
MSSETPSPYGTPARSDVAPETLAITAGRAASGASLAPALWASSTWESESLDDAHRRATSLRHDGFYSRYSNPTVRSFEQAIAELEGAEESLAFASGMGAVASTVFALCSTGSHIVTQRQLYAGTLAFLQGPCRRMGIDVTYVDVATPGAFAAAIEPGRTMLVLAETPSNPLLELADLDELGSIKGPFTVVDSTFATPLGQQPLAHGVDISLHSATKGIAGHNDATLGVISGDADLLGEIWAYSVLHGATPSPFDALNALRGVRTLGVRTRHQNETARSLAITLADHPEVVAVHYPGLSEHPQHALASKQLRQYGTVLSFEVADRDTASAVLGRLRTARVATSLGGPETIVCHPATSTHASLTPEEKLASGVSEVCCASRSAWKTRPTSSPTSNVRSRRRPDDRRRPCSLVCHSSIASGDGPKVNH